MKHPDNGMYSIKLVNAVHLHRPECTDDFDGTDGRYPVMNFSKDGIGPSVAAGIRDGHCSLVYVPKPNRRVLDWAKDRGIMLPNFQKFLWAIEYVGTIEDGKAAALAHGLKPNDPTAKHNIYRRIRFLARVAPESAPTLAEITNLIGDQLSKPLCLKQLTIRYISKEDYQKIYDAIPWQWTIEKGPWMSATPTPPTKL